MAYAHQGIELKQIPGLAPQQPTAPRVADNKKEPADIRPISALTRRGAEALVRVERLMDDATRALVTRSEPAKAAGGQDAGPRRADALAEAPGRQPAGTVRGN
jgi:penicillin-binding protein 1A